MISMWILVLVAVADILLASRQTYYLHIFCHMQCNAAAAAAAAADFLLTSKLLIG